MPPDLSPETLPKYQIEDPFCKDKIDECVTGKTAKSVPTYFLDSRNILCRRTSDQGRVFESICLPVALVPLVLDQSHNLLGHNGTPRTYEFLRRMYFWAGMQKDITEYCRTCLKCQQMNVREESYPPLHLNIPSMPMHMIAMDLIGKLPRTTSGKVYALTLMDMLTGFLWAIPIPDKQADTIIRSFLTHFFEKEGGCFTILTDNGGEFKNAKFAKVTEQLGIQHIFTSAYHPKGNSKLEHAHRFLKECLAKYSQDSQLEWDELLSKAVCAYNFFPNQVSRESPFFLMTGRDPITPLTKILGPRRRYLGEVGEGWSQLSLDQLTRCWALAAFNIKMARDANPEVLKSAPPGSLHVGDPVLLRNFERLKGHNKLAPKYLAQYRIVRFVSDRQVEIMSAKGVKRNVNIKDIHYQYPAEQLIRQLPEEQAFGRAAKFVYHPANVSNLHWTLTADLYPQKKPPKLTKSTNTD